MIYRQLFYRYISSQRPVLLRFISSDLNVLYKTSIYRAFYSTLHTLQDFSSLERLHRTKYI